MIPDYNRVAWFYDKLARLIFGDKLEQTKMAHLDQLKPNNKILVVGGGSGNLLRYIDKLGFNCHVDFVEASQKMLAKAQKITTNNLTVNFYHKDILDHSGYDYDIIFTNFFFDQFNRSACEDYISYLKTMARPGALLIYADFTLSTRLPDRLVRYMMYSFFRLTIKLGKVQFLDHNALFLEQGLVAQQTVSISSFIAAGYYKIP